MGSSLGYFCFANTLIWDRTDRQGQLLRAEQFAEPTICLTENQGELMTGDIDIKQLHTCWSHASNALQLTCCPKYRFDAKE